MGVATAKIRPTLALWGARFGFMSYGWDAGVLGGVLETTSFQSAMKYPNTTILAMIVASFLLASWLGCCIVAMPWSSRLGRRHWIMLGSLVQIIGTVVSVTSYSYGQLIAGRVIIGIGNGMVVSSAPSYIAEITPAAKLRGALVGVLMGFACTGTAIAYWVDFGFTFASGQVVWRLPVALQIVWSLLSIALLWPNADSPRWYFLRGREADGDAVLKQIYPDEQSANQVRKEIMAELRQENNEKLRWSDIIVDKSETQSVRRIRDGVVLVGVAYLMGINMIFYYMTTIFQSYIGLEAHAASICSGAATTLLAIGVFFGSYVCESRRKWLLWGAAAQSVFIIAFTALLAVPNKRTSSAAAAMLFGWILVFSPTWAPLPYIYVSETMPLRHRHTGVGLSISSQWLMAFLTVYAGPIGIANVGWKTWIWFAVFNVIGFPYVYFFIYETKGKSLEHMNELYSGKLAIDESSSSSSDSDVNVSEKTAAETTAAPASN
ncbi:general substrate transporter [Thermoascus aurantiacus ATCC 26904]